MPVTGAGDWRHKCGAQLLPEQRHQWECGQRGRQQHAHHHDWQCKCWNRTKCSSSWVHAILHPAPDVPDSSSAERRGARTRHHCQEQAAAVPANGVKVNASNLLQEPDWGRHLQGGPEHSSAADAAPSRLGETCSNTRAASPDVTHIRTTDDTQQQWGAAGRSSTSLCLGRRTHAHGG